MKRLIPFGLVLLALVTAGAVWAVTTQEDPPGPPSWVNADGTVNSSKAPASFSVIDENGDPVVCANGKTLKVPKGLLLSPPRETPNELQARCAGRGGGDFVWRCGKGGNPHQNPVRVPAAD